MARGGRRALFSSPSSYLRREDAEDAVGAGGRDEHVGRVPRHVQDRALVLLLDELAHVPVVLRHEVADRDRFGTARDGKLILPAGEGEPTRGAFERAARKSLRKAPLAEGAWRGRAQGTPRRGDGCAIQPQDDERRLRGLVGVPRSQRRVSGRRPFVPSHRAGAAEARSRPAKRAEGGGRQPGAPRAHALPRERRTEPVRGGAAPPGDGTTRPLRAPGAAAGGGKKHASLRGLPRAPRSCRPTPCSRRTHCGRASRRRAGRCAGPSRARSRAARAP